MTVTPSSSNTRSADSSQASEYWGAGRRIASVSSTRASGMAAMKSSGRAEKMPSGSAQAAAPSSASPSGVTRPVMDW